MTAIENKENILQQIKKIADMLIGNKSTYSRADLAYELKKMGLSGDSAEVAALIWDAFKKYNNDTNIANAFIGNSGRRTVVEEQEALSHFQEGNTATALATIGNNRQSTNNALQRLANDVEFNLNQTGKGASLADYILGTAGVKNIKEAATSLMGKYTEMTDAYGDAQDAVRASIDDFVTIRSAILDVYQKYVTALTDVFGHSVKSIAPELFDFDQISYLDTSAMLQRFQLEFQKVDDNCSALMNEIGNSFQHSLEASMTDIRLVSKTNKSIALVMAGLNMVNHYLQAADKSNRMESDYLQLKRLARKDIATIKTDMARLFVINQVIDNTLLPKAQLFFKEAEHLLNGELADLQDAIYDNPQTKGLKKERDSILYKLRMAETELADHQRHIELYGRLIAEANEELERKLPIYNEAKTRQPEEPSILENMISFGSAKKNYARALFDWNAACAPLVHSYDDMKNDVIVNQTELSFHKEAAEACQHQLQQLHADLDTANQKMMNAIKTDNETKKAMLKHLKPIVGLLALAKEIMTEKLDDQLLAAKSIVPVSLEDSLHGTIADNVDRFSNYIQNEIAKTPTKEKIDEQVRTYISNTAEIVHKIINLEIEKDQQRILQEQYDVQVEEYFAEMRQYLEKVNNKADFIRSVAQKVNSSDNPSKAKQSLLKLCKTEYEITDSDWDDFLAGKKNLIL
ncbi:MAG: hypothetical protein KBT32_02750 [Bacteroidales bacterium]|nr:hypothetical protein [Candidatus Physcocola equi]